MKATAGRLRDGSGIEDAVSKTKAQKRRTGRRAAARAGVIDVAQVATETRPGGQA